ncbi:hypothetical protein Tco_1005069 [Tanacetum coccineum]|uniref:Uncharacterized protein n=1 Tax=Tanacetum coccineum TaxID=301880 RepID=A0ABQ5FDP0_9ASTR
MNDRSCGNFLMLKDVDALIEYKMNVIRVELKAVSNSIQRIAQLEKKSVLCPLVTLSNQKVLAPWHVCLLIVKPIHPPLKNNRSAHLNYINHLKESVETVREIVEEARVVKPLDNALNSACRYTKLSQELLEYVIGTCPKEFNTKDNKAASTPLTRKKQVTFNDTCETSTSNTQKHVVQQKVQQSNVPVIPSTRVSSSTDASRSKPRSNTKKNMILPAKSENKMKVEDHPRTNKSVWTKVNQVESSISSKRVVINSNSESVCKTCNKCLIYANHDMCVIKPLNSVNATPTVKNGLNKVKQVWKVKGKLSANGLNKAKQVWKATGKVFANVGYQWRPTRKKFTLGKHIGGHQWRPTGKMFLLGEQCPLTRLPVKCTTISANQQDPNQIWGSEIPNLQTRLFLNAGPTYRPLVSGLRLFKTYDGNVSKAQEVSGKSFLGKVEFKMTLWSYHGLWRVMHLYQIMTSVHISSGLVLHHNGVCRCLFRPRSLIGKKSVRFSALSTREREKRNLLVFDHFHQQVSYFPRHVTNSLCRCGSCGMSRFKKKYVGKCSSKKQRSTVISTIEAEYIAMSGCCAQIL